MVSKITVDGDQSHEIKRHLFLERKAMTNLDSVLKSRDTTMPIKVHIIKVKVFPVVMYRCESWTMKNAEHQRIDGWHHWLNGYESEQTPGDSEGPGKLGVLQSMGSQRVRQDLATEQQQRIQRNWTKLSILS